MRGKVVKIRTGFKSRIYNKFLRKGKSGCQSHPFLDPNEWNEFLKRRSTPTFKAKSDRARECAAKNTCVPHLGRSGYPGLEAKAPVIWPSLEKSNKSLEGLENEHTKTFIMSRAKENKATKSYELPPATIQKVNKLVNNCK